MRVITGSARGAKLITLEGTDTRPTADGIKEAMFSMIQFEIEGRRVLDLFAGSGQLGIEALSRGAVSCTFTDRNTEAVEIIKKNLIHTKLFERAKVLSADYASFLSHASGPYDVVFLDPPYGQGMAEKALELVSGMMSDGGVIVVETAKEDVLPDEAGKFRVATRRNHGKTAIHLYRDTVD